MRRRKNELAESLSSIVKLVGLLAAGYAFVKLFEDEPKKEKNPELDNIGNPIKDEVGGQGGNPKAKNSNGSGQFPYRVFQQSFKDVGFACKVSSVLSVYKSLGLIHPEASGKELEKNNLSIDYPMLYKNESNRGISIPIFPLNLNKSLRGFKNFKIDNNGQKGEDIKFNDRLKLADILLSANNLANHSEYAKLKGMAGKKFRLVKLNTLDEIIKQIDKGYVVRVFVNTYPSGHYVTITTMVRGENKKLLHFIADDNLFGDRARYELSNIVLSVGDLERQAFSIEPIFLS
jgi:hypothetical protein